MKKFRLQLFNIFGVSINPNSAGVKNVIPLFLIFSHDSSKCTFKLFKKGIEIKIKVIENDKRYNDIKISLLLRLSRRFMNNQESKINL